MSREGYYCKCSKRPVVCREKATTASVVRGPVVWREGDYCKCSMASGMSEKVITTSVVWPVVWREKATTEV